SLPASTQPWLALFDSATPCAPTVHMRAGCGKSARPVRRGASRSLLAYSTGTLSRRERERGENEFCICKRAVTPIRRGLQTSRLSHFGRVCPQGEGTHLASRKSPYKLCLNLEQATESSYPRLPSQYCFPSWDWRYTGFRSTTTTWSESSGGPERR